jgi:hypothetical protein
MFYVDYLYIFAQLILKLQANIKIMNEILLRYKTKKRIKDELNTSYPTIRLALLGETHTKLSARIRAKAIELGGIEIIKPI